MSSAPAQQQQQQASSKLSLEDFLPNENSKRKQPPTDEQHLTVGQSKTWRQDIWLETKQTLEAGKYNPYRGKPNEFVNLPPLDTQMNVMSLKTHPKSMFMHQQQQQQQQQGRVATSSSTANNKNNKPPLKITCYRGDCLDAARICFVKQNGTDQPFVMNAASHKRPGGGYQNGSRAQEEEMCRRTSLAFQIDSTWKRQQTNPYPLQPGTGHFEKNVSVFRAGPKDHYSFLPKPFVITMGAVAAPVSPSLTPDGKMMAQDGAEKMSNSLKLFFRMAVAAQSKTVVPVALGCGAFRCPASHTCKLMMEAIVEEICSNDASCVEEVMIAIFDDHNAVRKGNEEGNFAPFARAALSYFGESSVDVIDEDGTDLKQTMFGISSSAAAKNTAESSSSSSSQRQQNESKATQQQKRNNDDDKKKNRLQ